MLVLLMVHAFCFCAVKDPSNKPIHYSEEGMPLHLDIGGSLSHKNRPQCIKYAAWSLYEKDRTPSRSKVENIHYD